MTFLEYIKRSCDELDALGAKRSEEYQRFLKTYRETHLKDLGIVMAEVPENKEELESK